MGLLLISCALVMWLAEVAMPLHFALLAVGGSYIAIGVILYFASLRASLRQWQRRLTVVYGVSATIDLLYRRVVLFLKRIMDITI